MEHVRVVSVNKSEWLQVLKSIKVGVNGSFIFFFFLKNRKISSFTSDQMFFFFFLICFAICVRQFLMESSFIRERRWILNFFYDNP